METENIVILSLIGTFMLYNLWRNRKYVIHNIKNGWNVACVMGGLPTTYELKKKENDKDGK